MSAAMKPVDAADHIVESIRKLYPDMVIQRYDAISTNSIYLKMDYGMLKSLRISDHKGKNHLKYRYNILINVKKEYYNKNDIRFYYPCTKAGVKKFIEQLSNDCADKRERYGPTAYQHYMYENKAQNENNTHGFWHQAEEV